MRAAGAALSALLLAVPLVADIRSAAAAALEGGEGDPGAGETALGSEDADPDQRQFDPWALGAGTIFCDGQLRGSATLLNPAPELRDLPGRFIATAAHVLWDLERERRFLSCEFRFMGLGEVPGFQAPIDNRWIRSGNFHPDHDLEDESFGHGDWAFIYLPRGLGSHLRARGLDIGTDGPAGTQDTYSGGAYLVAWNRDREQVRISGRCRVQSSRPGDLGGGAWEGQLLDDCDSSDGASGGGLFMLDAGRLRLVGIRTGSHWDGERYPDGPPAGAPWDVRANTNFARALTTELLEAFAVLAHAANGQQRSTALPGREASGTD